MFEMFYELKEHEQTDLLIDQIRINTEEGIILSGIGKNWYISEKVAKSYLSMGIKAHALDVTHALHGDIGLIRNQPIIFTSKSGKTKELLDLIKYLYHIRDLMVIRPIMIGIFLEHDSPAEEWLDVLIEPESKNVFEFDSNNIIPSLSINIIQMYLDWIGVQVFEGNVSLMNRFKYNHPGGNIGAQLDMNKEIE
jgi:arabinose-5-phosphate isomerase